MILSIRSFSQIVFENGYFIDESDLKTECLIKNVDWKHNPTEFEYKLSPTEAIQIANIQNIKEFGINGVSKYIRAIVKLDRSSDLLYNMSSDRNPDFQEEQLFLKILIEGKASLFLYNVTRFFYKLDDSEIRPLVYKRYLHNNKLAYNNSFRQQLLVDLKCQGIYTNNVNNIEYSQRDLKRFFIEYNECSNSAYIEYEPEQKRDFFNLSFRPGLNCSSLAIQSFQSDDLDTDFGNRISYRFGIESEFILPYNKNKWSIIIEPTYQSYKAEERIETSEVVGGIRVSEVNYKSIDVSFGLRHYFFLNNVSKIYTNISYIYDIDINSDIEFRRIDGSVFNSFEIEQRGGNLALGFGYKYKDRYSLEIQYQTSREVLSNQFWESKYKTVSVIFGYSLF